MGSPRRRLTDLSRGGGSVRGCGRAGSPLRFASSRAAPIVLIGSGVALVATGGHEGLLVGLHKASFVVRCGAISLHFLAYLLRLPGIVAADWRLGRRLPGRLARYGLVTGAVAAGLVLAVAFLPWLHAWDARRFGHDGRYDDSPYRASAFSRRIERAAPSASAAGSASASTSASAPRQRAAARK
jgi:hypothetical protein